MPVLYILGGIVLLAVLMGQLRIRVWAALEDDATILTLQVGPVRRQLLPPPPKAPKKKTPEKAPAPQAPAAKKPRPKLTGEDIRTLWPAARQALGAALGKTRRRIRIDPMELCILTGGEPYDAALLYGRVTQAVFTAMPLLEALLRIPDPRIHIGMAPEAERTRVTGSVGIRLRVADALAIAIALAGPLLGWLLRRRKAAGARTPGDTSETGGTQAA